MSSNLEAANAKIVTHIEKLHRLVKTRLSQSLEIFEDLDIASAEEIIETGSEIENLFHIIENLTFATITDFSPHDKDLRRLVAYLHTAIGLQRVGRYAYKIMEIVTLSDGLDHFKELVTLPYLGELANTAISISIRAVLEEDLTEIDELEKLEAQSDNEATEMFQEIASYLNTRRDISTIAMLYVIVGRYFERAADQAINIAEYAVYLVNGERKKLGLAYKGVDDISDILLDI